MLDFDLSFHTELAILRPITLEDIPLLAPRCQDASLWTYFTSDLSDVSTLENWIHTAVKQTQAQTRLAFTIVDTKTNSPIGSTSLGNISERDSRIEIGWTWLAKEYHGKGINAKVKYLLLKYCFEVLKVTRVEFKTDVLNTPARKALQKLGITEEGILRSHTLMTNDRRRDTIFYSVLADEWEQVKSFNHWS